MEIQIGLEALFHEDLQIEEIDFSKFFEKSDKSQEDLQKEEMDFSKVFEKPDKEMDLSKVFEKPDKSDADFVESICKTLNIFEAPQKKLIIKGTFWEFLEVTLLFPLRIADNPRLKNKSKSFSNKLNVIKDAIVESISKYEESFVRIAYRFFSCEITRIKLYACFQLNAWKQLQSILNYRSVKQFAIQEVIPGFIANIDCSLFQANFIFLWGDKLNVFWSITTPILLEVNVFVNFLNKVVV